MRHCQIKKSLLDWGQVGSKPWEGLETYCGGKQGGPLTDSRERQESLVVLCRTLVAGPDAFQALDEGLESHLLVGLGDRQNKDDSLLKVKKSYEAIPVPNSAG